MNPITFQFAPGKIRGVALFAAKGDIRYCLNGVYFTRAPNGKGMIAVATDGHRLTVIYHEQDVASVPEGFGVIVPTAELLMAATKPIKPTGMSALDVAFQVEGIAVTMKAAVTVTVNAIEGKFPDYQKVIPPLKGRKHGGIATVQAGYLADYAKLAALVKPGKSDYHKITVSAIGPNESVVVGIGVPNCVCILMPMRGDSDDFVERDWLSGAK